MDLSTDEVRPVRLQINMCRACNNAVATCKQAAIFLQAEHSLELQMAYLAHVMRPVPTAVALSSVGALL